jgi:hypothetical protein
MTMMSPPRPVQRAADRGRQPEPARGQLDLGFRVLVWADPRRGERQSVPGRFEHGAEVVGMLFGEVSGIADANNAARGVMPEDEGRKGDRGRNRSAGLHPLSGSKPLLVGPVAGIHSRAILSIFECSRQETSRGFNERPRSLHRNLHTRMRQLLRRVRQPDRIPL